MVVHENYLRAGNPETPVDELRRLFCEPDHRVRRRLAENEGTPEDVLRLLAQDENPEVRIAVAENKNTPADVVGRLAEDTDVYVRFALAGQYNLPMHLLERLAEEDENPYVRDHAGRTLQGLFLEKALKEVQFISRPGQTDKLGELLVWAGAISQTHVEELLRSARERQIPLGRAIVQNRALARNVVVAALKAQLKIRDGEWTTEDALREIRQALGGRE